MQLEQLRELMEQHISSQRLEKINEISLERTRYLTVVLEDVFYTQNISAVVRTCDCMGIQDVHLIGKSPSTRINTHVSLGASNWVHIHKRNDESKETVLRELKEQGYRLAATVPGDQALTLSEFDPAGGKCAIIMGSEAEGVSDLVKEMADLFITIPMWGFSDSFNISVSTAILLYEMTQKLRASGLPWQLSQKDLEALRYDWIKKSVRKSRGEAIEREYEKRLAHPNDQA